MTTDSVDSLEDLAARVDEEFGAHRQPNKFKTISLVIDTSRSDRSTLIVHCDSEEASSLADEVEAFLREHDVHIQREHHSETDIRVLATLN